MARARRNQPESAPEPPACYAMVHPGLEEIAADEIRRDLGGDVRKTSRGIVVFRLNTIDERILTLRTTEDVFLLAWGSDQLTYRATDLDLIQRWTARSADWQRLLKIHHAVRPRPKGKPTYRLVAQMEGEHGYMRKHTREALAKGLAGHIPDSWPEAEENASVEVWLSIDGATAVCGLRLSDRTMRHRNWKLEHRAASLRPTVAAAMVRAAAVKPGQVVVDPMCGVGTILAEASAYADRFRGQPLRLMGGDLEFAAVRAGSLNLRRLGAPFVARWDARRLPLAGGVVDQIVSNPPFGKQMSSPGEIGPLYRAMAREYDRVLRPGGQVVLLVSDMRPLRDAAEKVGWRSVSGVSLRILGQPARISVWRKGDA
jgi:tRNA (guanine6-N2)-methyltransferase